MTCREVFSAAAQLADRMKQEGMKTGDLFTVCLQNRLEFALLYFASMVGGYTMVPLNASWSQSDTEYIVDLVRPVLRLDTAAASLLSDLRFTDQAIEIRMEDQDLMTIFFTSGTTGQPKGVCHTAAQMIQNALAFNRLTGLDETVRMLHVMPIGYMAGFLNTILCPLLAGGSIILAPQCSPSSALHFWNPAMEHQANAIWLTPTMASLVARLCRSEQTAAWVRENIKYAFIGTAPLLDLIRKAFEEKFGIPCLESYGMSEVLFVSCQIPNDSTGRNGSVGKRLDSIQLENRTAEGYTQSLWVHSPYALKGYLQPNQQMESPLEQGWLPTGDCGHLDENGNLFITGRYKDLIICGGMNISPRALEERLSEHENIQEVAVVGKPDAFWGEIPVAFLVVRCRTGFDLKTLDTFCCRTVAPEALPKEYHVVSELPRSGTGKIQKHKLLEQI